MDWREMLRITGATMAGADPEVGAANAATVQQNQDTPLKKIAQFILDQGKVQDQNPDLVPHIPGQRTQEDIWTNGGFDPQSGAIVDNWGGPPVDGAGQGIVSEEDGIRIGQAIARKNASRQAPMDLGQGVSDTGPQTPTQYPNFPGNPDEHVSNGLPGQGEGYDLDRIMSMYKPEHTATDELRQMMHEFPHREKLKWWERLASIGMGAAGATPDSLNHYANGRYDEQVRDYELKMRPIIALAQMERGDNSNERAWALGLLRDRYNDRRADTAAARERDYYAKVQADIENNRNKTAIADRLATVKEYLMNHPDMKAVKDVKSGNIILVNPKTGEQKDTGLKHGDVSDIELEQERQRGRETLQDSRNEGAAERTEAGKWTVVNADGTSYRLNTATGEMLPIGKEVSKPGTAKSGTANKPMSQKERIDKLKLNFDKILRDNPEFEKRGLIMHPDTRMPVFKKNHNFTDEEKAIINQRLNSDIYDDKGNTSAASVGTVDIPQAPVVSHGAGNKPGASLGQPPAKIKVTNPEGKVGFIPFDQWPAAEKQGYKKAY